MDTTINTNIEATTDISNIDNMDAFADLDDDPPGLCTQRRTHHKNRPTFIKYIKQRLGILAQLALGSLVGGMAGSYVGFPSSIENSRHSQCILTAGGLPAKACPWAYKIG
jgi:hypothetical protein